ncbi:MAG: isocitrate/isopropylmalate family dehydrogenase [Myxococcota bacterium]|nr:isocitrate/isopropylmalate family dehydrogenase [Myxococcota bacterium]
MKHTVVLIPGDGIGPEVTAAARQVLDASGVKIDWLERHAGVAALEHGSDSLLPASTTDAILEHKLAMKGPCTTPIAGGFSSVNVALRKQLKLYGAIRPIRNIDGITTRYSDVDCVIVRENTEGLYSGIENVITEGVVTSLKVATERACRRIATFAFEYARERGRKKVTAFHKANIMKLSDGLFIRCAREVHENYSEIEYDEVIIDAGCMKVVSDPTQFDIILCENLYGDLMSDLCAGLVGGLGVTPGANIGESAAVFEAVHGTAPDIAGRGIANPLAMIMSSVMMLNHIATTRNDASAKAAAERIKVAYNQAILAGEKTGDLGGHLNTQQFADALIRRL